MIQIDKQISNLNTELIEMGSMIENNINASITALVAYDAIKAAEIIEYDVLVNAKEKEIQDMCLQIFMRFQPVASDLRHISAILKIITDLERIGDHAADIASITIQLQSTNHNLSFDKIQRMADDATSMVRRSIDSFISKDLVLTTKILNDDDLVDSLFYELKMDIVNGLYQNQKDALEGVDLLLIAKYLERIGDHACNIARWVSFSITGLKI